jgi:hypothetical protein
MDKVRHKVLVEGWIAAGGRTGVRIGAGHGSLDLPAETPTR